MLSDEVIDKVVERLAVRMEHANEYVLQEIGKSIKKLGTLTPSKAQELVQIMKYGGDYKKITRKIKEITKLNIKDIEEIFKEVAKNDYAFAEQFYKYRNKKYIPWAENKELQQQVKALASMTARKYANLTNTLAFATHDKNGRVVYTQIAKMYQQVLDEAVLNVGQGKETFDNAMYRILKELGESGIKTIDYESGRSVRADSTTRMLMQDSLRNLHNETQKQFGEEFDSDGIEISVHLNPAPDHELVQGRQFSNEEFNKFQNDQDAVSYDGIVFPAIADETGHDRRAISQYNCYHYTFAIVLGISEPEYSNKELQQIINDNNKGFDFDGKHYTMYEGTQLQRKLETEIRKQKDIQIIGRASGNEELIAESQYKTSFLVKKYKELSNASGLPTKTQRLKVSNYYKQSTKEFDNKVKLLYNIGTKEENAKLYFKAKRKQAQIRNGDVNLNIIAEKQSKHNIDDPNYIKGKSYFNLNLEEEQELVNKHAGHGFIPNTKKGELSNKEICTTDKIIGKYINKNLKKEVDTNSFVIHYSKDGVHIVPADYRKVNKNE